MKRSLFIRLTISLFLFCLCLYYYVHKQNQLTALKIELPKQMKELEIAEEENHRLQYEIDQFENPYHLMELTQCLEFSHLKHPFVQDILSIPQGIALQEDFSNTQVHEVTASSLPITIGKK